MTSLLRVDGLAGGYGDVTVVRDVSLRVDGGQAVFLAGRNGVGKSTLVKLIAGQLAATGGTTTLDGRDMTALPQHGRRLHGIGYAPQEGVVFDDLSILDNLTLHYPDRDLNRYGDLFRLFPRIEERLQQMAGTLSGGEKKILSFCRALAEDTPLVILDEPSEGVQPENIDRMARVILDQKARGRAFLVVEQNLTLVEDAADHVYLLDHGECVFETGRSNDLREDLSKRLQI
ncbi:ABC transporter ATP-binding protein [Hoeflea poritis]|uniref:ATP-binding cassette domain-containing protein n=1 Tax=Hoeflea poritis TaxID=2993659 RepID=A0ABT4VMH6_9HYPH|nr:ATP-binding cassette domain-containing protein [Hoeflea poritis]MDA4845908.1 ATP-binding cassette domain-containing protein [Hoeflea poritis]